METKVEYGDGRKALNLVPLKDAVYKVAHAELHINIDGLNGPRTNSINRLLAIRKQLAIKLLFMEVDFDENAIALWNKINSDIQLFLYLQIIDP